MEEFIQKMVTKVGIDAATAKKVMAFLSEHSDDAVKYLSKNDTVKDLAGKLPGGLGSKLGL